MGIQEDWVSEREEFIEVGLVRGFGGGSGRERSCQKDKIMNVLIISEGESWGLPEPEIYVNKPSP